MLDGHRHLTKSQRAAAAALAADLYREAAKERQGTRADLVEQVPPSSMKARDEAGRDYDVSGRYVAEAQRIREQAPPKIFEALT